MKKSKFFSLALMREGIKQTKSLGICLTVISLIVACFNPFIQIFNGSEASFYDVTVNGFVAPIFSMFYFIPAILIFGLFGFLNKRNSSDFYHSVPLNRSCVYITYAAATMVWCVFIMLVSTFSSYILCSFATNVMITPYFIWIALYSSFIAAFLVMSIALVAMGLSGTFFSDIVTFLLIMFAPRLIISAFVSAISSAVPIVSVESMSILRPYVNILFVPFESGAAYSELMTDWGIMLYSFILAVVYFVGGFFIHRARKSESAENAVAFRCVRHIVRSLIGIVPTLIICYPLASKLTLNESKEALNTALLILAVGVSVIAYFIYEFITTRSVKKLLAAIPLYLIVAVFDLAFIFGSQAIGNSILNTVPVQSDIKSVSVRPVYENYEYYGTKTYQECKAKSFDYENEELIEILCKSLEQNVEILQKRGYLNPNGISSYSVYNVIFRCNNGTSISRRVYVPNSMIWVESLEESYDKIYKLMCENESFKNLDTLIPDDNEIKRIYITGYSNTIYSNKFTNEEVQKIWHTFRNEYVSLSRENKLKACGYGMIDNPDDISRFCIYLKGYMGAEAFYGECFIGQSFTPRTYKTIIETLSKYEKPLSSDEANLILTGINENNYFEISVQTVNNRTGFNSMYYDPETITTLDKKDFENVAKAVKILTDSAQKGCDMSKDNVYMVSFLVDTEGMPVQKYEYADGGSYSMRQIDCFVNLTDEEYREFCGIVDDFWESQENSGNSMIEDNVMYD
ncbi:MAG: hypothetical protein ACI4GV_01030 [Acutalibacteraceae bacterium]